MKIFDRNLFQRNLFFGLIIVFSLFLTVSCGNSGSGSVAGTEFSIEGTFPVCNGDSFFVYQLDYQVSGVVPIKIASAAIDKSGGEAKVHLSGNVPGKGFYLVGQAPNNLATVILGGEKGISMTGNCMDLRRFAKIENSPVNRDFQIANGRHNQLQQKSNSYRQQINIGMQTNDPELVNSSRSMMTSIYQQQVALLDSLRSANPFLAKFLAANMLEPFDPQNNPNGYSDGYDHFAGEYMKQVDFNDPAYEYIPVVAENMRSLVQQFFSGNLPGEQATGYMNAFLDRIPDGTPLKKKCMAVVVSTLDQMRKPVYMTYAGQYESMYVLTDAEQQVLDSKKSFYQAQAAAETRLQIGAIPPEIELPTPEGENLKLSDLRGKVVLVDFWASWCRPCRRENPNVVKVYNKYKDQGFDILSVSLDRSRDPWLQAIKADQMSWNHVSDLKFWQSEAAKAYRVSSIPATFLLDKDGKIIAKNLRGPALEAKVAEVLASS